MTCLPYDVANKALSVLLEGVKTPYCGLEPTERSIDRLAKEADQLELVISAFRNHVHTYRISPIRRQQNLLSPIYRLPDELLVEIFSKVKSSSTILRRHDRHRVNQTLAEVSSRWRSTAISSPTLWVALSTDVAPKATALMLERSQNAPLRLCFSQRNERHTRSLIELVAPHMARWKTLHCPSKISSRIVSEFLVNRRLPSIESLVLREKEAYTGNLEASDIGTPLNIIAPSLKKLETVYLPFPLRIEPGLHSKLTVLLFTACKDGVPFLAGDYHILLSSAPYLEDITIYGLSSPEHRDPQIGIPVDIPLMNLKVLKLRILPYETIGYLISSISTAPDGYPHIMISGELAGLPSDMFPRTSISNSLVQAISGSHWAHVTTSYTDDSEIGSVGILTGTEVLGVRRSVFEVMLICNGLPPVENV